MYYVIKWNKPKHKKSLLKIYIYAKRKNIYINGHSHSLFKYLNLGILESYC